MDARRTLGRRCGWPWLALLLCTLEPRTAAAAELMAPILELPVECVPGQGCAVQNYVDQEPGGLAKDFTCGPLSYDGHDGTDIRLPGLPEMQAGVAVLAAAPGVVRAARDGMPDVSIRHAGTAAVAGREAGNAVVIDHGEGWETQYSHLRSGSVAVAPGQRVAPGTRLGLIGLSGKTEFPHLHFEIRKDGQPLDPFTGRPPEAGCGGPAGPLWSPRAAELLAYRPGGSLLAGFAAAEPTLEAILAGEQRESGLSITAPVLVFWAASWGLRAGDQEAIRLLAPDDSVLAEGTFRVPGNKAQWLRYTGRRRPAAAPWPAGRYRGEYRIVRQTEAGPVTIVELGRDLEVR